MNTTSRTARMGWALLLLGAAAAGAVAAAPPAKTPAERKPSSYAPAADLQQQFEYFLGRIEQDLSDPKAYGKDQQERVAKDANTLAVIALVLGKHDQKSTLQAAAPGLISTAAAISENAGDYAKAKADLDGLKAAMKSSGDVGKLKWEPVADLTLLMKQVPIVNNSLRRGVTGRRFARSVDQNAGLAATLAAISQATMTDTDYCADEEDEAQWRKVSIQMRDAAAEVNAAVRKKDQAAAKKSLAKLVLSCDACHDSFR